MTTGSAGYVLRTRVNLLRSDIPVCQILSIAFEFAEYSLQHQLANFAEVRHAPSSLGTALKITAIVLVGSCA